MTTRYHRLTRASVDRIVDGAPTGAEAAPVSALLAELRTAPIEPDSDGERLAVAAFRAAQSAPCLAPAVGPPRRPRLVRLAVKVAVVAAILAASSVAAATGDDVLPHLFVGDTRGAVPSARSPAPPARSTSTTSSRSVTPHTSPTGRPTTSAPAAPPAIVDACRAYQGTDPATRAKALDKHRYAALVAAAGGRDRVDQYCARLVLAAAPASTKAHPAHPPHPHPKH
jgi:hypothetical protein